MVIKASAAHHIKALLDDLQGANETTREVAIARLIVLGAPAVDRLSRLARDAASAPAARIAALGALEAIGDPRVLLVAIATTADPNDEVAATSVGVVRSFLVGPQGIEALDALTALALDAQRSDPIRVAAISAMRGGLNAPSGFDADTLQPILRALAGDPRPRIRAAGQMAARWSRPDVTPSRAGFGDEEGGPLPDDPAEVRRHVLEQSAQASLASLLQLIVRIREREADAPDAQRVEWTLARGAAHVALAKRGSRLALYDLRESLEAAQSALPVEMLSALILVGDKSCLEPIVAAYARLASGSHATGISDEREARAGHEEWWPRHLADAFHTIVERGGLTRRQALLKRAEARWPDAVQALWRRREPSRTKAGRS